MIAWLFRLFLLAELALLAALGCYLDRGGMDPEWIVCMLVMIAVVWRLSHGAVTWCVAQAWRLAKGRAPDWTNQIVALIKETGARAVSFNWSQPFPALAMRGDPVGVREGTPILLVHGFFSNRGIWHAMRRRLVYARLGPVYLMELSPVFGRVPDMASSLEARIESICRETGAERIHIVAHSMGGLVSREVLRRQGGRRIRRLITLGSPHRGTTIAAIALFPCVKDMQRGGEFLAQLERAEASSPPAVKATSIYSRNDDLVFPPETSRLPWADNVELNGVGHVSLLFSREVALRVIALLRRQASQGAK